MFWGRAQGGRLSDRGKVVATRRSFKISRCRRKGYVCGAPHAYPRLGASPSEIRHLPGWDRFPPAHKHLPVARKILIFTIQPLSPPQCTYKSPRQHDVAGGLIQLGCEGCAKPWLSTCRPCRPCRPYRAWRACPSWVRAFRQWRIRWSGAGKPRKRRSAERYGPPSWGR